MDLQQAKILLEKINALHKSVSLDKGDVSNIERDLMLSYIRQFYEAYLNTDTTAAPQPMSRTVEPPPPAPPVEKTVSEPLPPRVEVEPAPPPPPPPPAPKPEPVVEIPAPAPVPPAPSAPEKKTASAGVEALFKHKAAKELSEKLSQQTITDLTRAMSINDKLLYSNELFGRDMAAMNENLQQLNKLNSMEEARELLIDIAEKNDWAEDERTDVAESFIKLVRRKY